MTGFGRVALIGEYYNQKIVNVLWYRSTDWLPLEGNPFSDMLNVIDGVLSTVKTALFHCLTADYTLHNVEGVGYDDAFNIVTSSPAIRDVEEHGTVGTPLTVGASLCAILGLRCGAQHSINGTGMSKRNRGYLAIGPMAESVVDNYQHITSDIYGNVNALGVAVQSPFTILLPPATFTPIRVHEKWTTILGLKHLDWRTYSDVLGYRVNNVASWRKSRTPRA